MSEKLFGLSEEGVKTALDIKTRYKKLLRDGMVHIDFECSIWG